MEDSLLIICGCFGTIFMTFFMALTFSIQTYFSIRISMQSEYNLSVSAVFRGILF